MRRLIVIVLIIILLAAGGWAGYTWYVRQNQAQAASTLQTVPLERGALTSTVGATGVVHTRQTTILAWQTSGTVGEVPVQVGDPVQTGDLLASLIETSLPQNVLLAQTELITARRTLDDLQNTQTVQAEAQITRRKAQAALLEAQAAWDVFLEDAYQDDLDQAEDDLIDAKDKLDDAIEDLEPYLDRDEDNATRKSYQERVDDAQLEYNEAARERDRLLLNRDQAQAELEAAQARLAEAEREVERLKDGPDPDEVANAQARITAAQATLNLRQLTAPIDGVVTDIMLKPGDQVIPGLDAIRVDDLSQLLVDVRLPEVDVNRVRVGQETTLTFDAILGKEYHGTVTEVAQVGASNQGVVEFIVTVQLTDADEAVRQGMTAAVTIVIEQLDNVILVPNRAVRVRDGKRVVYVLRQGVSVPLPITLGASSDTYSELVAGGIQVGEAIVLNPPPEFEGGGPPFGR